MGRRFCVRCGAEERDDLPIIDGLCPKHFLEERRILELPSKVFITMCPSCGSINIGNSWLPTDGSITNALETYINKALVKKRKTYPGFTNVKVLVKGIISDKAILEVVGKYKQVILRQEIQTYFEIRKKLCPRCSSIRNEVYEAMIQVRMEGPPREEIFRRIADRVVKTHEFTDVVKIEECREGIDLKFRNVSSARAISSLLKNEFSAHIKQTWKDYGFIRGKKHGKLTISVKVPSFLIGDVVEINGGLMTVVGVRSNGNFTFRDLETGSVKEFKPDDLRIRGFKLLTGKDYALISGRIINYEGGKAVVQASSGGIYYIRPSKILDLGSSVEILIYKGKQYLLI